MAIKLKGKKRSTRKYSEKIYFTGGEELFKREKKISSTKNSTSILLYLVFFKKHFHK